MLKTRFSYLELKPSISDWLGRPPSGLESIHHVFENGISSPSVGSGKLLYNKY